METISINIQQIDQERIFLEESIYIYTIFLEESIKDLCYRYVLLGRIDNTDL